MNNCELFVLDKQMNDLQQQLKANEVNIIGFPEKKNESILEVVRNISTAMD